MTAAIKPSPRNQPIAPAATKNSRRRSKVTALPVKPAPVSTVQKFPDLQEIPAWLKSLVQVQQGCSVLTVILVAVCLSIYGSSVYSQQKWHQQASKLETLRRQERQLIAANETLKNQIAKLADRPGSGLVEVKPHQMLLLEPAAPRPRPAGIVQKTANSHNLPNLDPSPLGY